MDCVITRVRWSRVPSRFVPRERTVRQRDRHERTRIAYFPLGLGTPHNCRFVSAAAEMHSALLDLAEAVDKYVGRYLDDPSIGVRNFSGEFIGTDYANLLSALDAVLKKAGEIDGE